ncbi:hypothetical protein O181_087149 [Austropuccinia psidii MF-1]|uniref:Integrase catalytic domain-containing protein n=1 Tax=Austropuccinia psidii MF-1 TaxID=1389203 RepID=A0A9Q3IP74_9BASI|nr:hypothetical protein [Austropuccinia psidii MF-1]
MLLIDTPPAARACVSIRPDPLMIHKQLGHPSNFFASKIFPSVNFSNVNCVSCSLLKSHQLPFSGSFPTPANCLDTIHMEICGPISPISHGGNKYVFQLIDGQSCMHFIYLLNSKSESFGKFVEFQRFAENQTGKQIKTVVSNNGSEFFNSKFQEIFLKRGIIHQPTAPYTPQKNPILERGNRTLFEKVRVMLYNYQVPSEWWGEACAMAMFILNRTPTSAISFQTPISRWSSLAMNLSNLHPFGFSAVIHVPKERQTSKVNLTGVLCILENSRLTRLYFSGHADASPNCASNSPVATPALESSESATISGGSEITPVVILACDEFSAPVLSPSPVFSSPILPAGGSQPCHPSFSR